MFVVFVTNAVRRPVSCSLLEVCAWPGQGGGAGCQGEEQTSGRLWAAFLPGRGLGYIAGWTSSVVCARWPWSARLRLWAVAAQLEGEGTRS